MVKKDLVQNLVNAGLEKKDAVIAVDTVIKSLTDAYTNGESVELQGFGTFSCKTRKARKGFNIATKQSVEIPERKMLVFKLSKGLMKKVNGED